MLFAKFSLFDFTVLGSSFICPFICLFGQFDRVPANLRAPLGFSRVEHLGGSKSLEDRLQEEANHLKLPKI
jgi:hypothetical protein